MAHYESFLPQWYKTDSDINLTSIDVSKSVAIALFGSLVCHLWLVGCALVPLFHLQYSLGKRDTALDSQATYHSHLQGDTSRSTIDELREHF